MLKAITKDDKTKLRGKKVSHNDIVDLIVELIELDYTGFNIKYSKLMQDVRKAYVKRLMTSARTQV